MREFLSAASAAIASLSEDDIAKVADIIGDVLRADQQVFLAGNGGSALNAAHFVVEIHKEASIPMAVRRSVRSLVDNVGVVTAFANDKNFEGVFAEQLSRLGKGGDLLVVLTVSGRSANILAAVDLASRIGVRVVAMTGLNPDQAVVSSAEHLIRVPSLDPAVVEVSHLAIAHALSKCKWR